MRETREAMATILDNRTLAEMRALTKVEEAAFTYQI